MPLLSVKMMYGLKSAARVMTAPTLDAGPGATATLATRGRAGADRSPRGCAAPASVAEPSTTGAARIRARRPAEWR